MNKFYLSLLTVLCFFSFSASAVPTDYLVLSWSEESGIQAEYHQIVDLPVRQTHQSNQSSHDLVQLISEEGTVVGEVSLKHARYTRAEYHGHNHIEGEAMINEEVVFVVRAQRGLVTQMILPDSLDSSRQMVNFNTLVDSAITKGPQVFKSTQGGIDNRINLLFMGDGYTSGQENDFNADVDAVVAYMQTFEPYQSYANFVSFDRLFTISNESGADKPSPCFNPTTFVDTAFDAKYCTSNIERLLTVNGSKIYTAAAAVPNWDEITVIVNDDHYGGAGGSFSTISTHDSADDVFIHEYGHSFTNLADEYTTPYPGFPACSDVSGNAPCEVNVTDETIRNNIKWNYLIAGSTPIPTPETSPFNNVVGLFEGARYMDSDVYRPQNNCNMKSLGQSFCAVCQQAYVNRVYTVAYAAGGNPLNLIEPGSSSPAATVNGMVSMPMTFALDTLQPAHDLQITWYIDGNSQGPINSSDVNQSWQFTPPTSGLVEITVKVKDNSSLVDVSQHDSLPEFEYIWQVDVQPFVDLIFTNGFET